MDSKISLVIPTYNSSKSIYDTLKSVKNQTLDPENFEVVIYDDGSTDGTMYACNKAVNDLDLSNSYFCARHENLGPAVTRNEAIDISRYNLISLLDSDDLLEPNALESTLNFMNDNPNVKYSYSRHRKIDSDNNVISVSNPIPYDSSKILHFNFVGPIKTFYKDLHNEIGGYDSENIVEDYDHILKASVLLNDDQIAQNPEILYNYVIHGGNRALDGNNNSQQFNAGNNLVKQNHICKSIENALKSKGENVRAFWSHFTPEGYNYYSWEEV